MKIIDIKELFDGKALGIEFDSGQKCTSWNDKNNPERIRGLIGVNVEPTLKPYVSKSGKTGINLVGIEVLEEGSVENMAESFTKQVDAIQGKPKPEVFLKDDKITAAFMTKCAIEMAKGHTFDNLQDESQYMCECIPEIHGVYKLALDRLNA